MEHIDRDIMILYAESLAEKVENGDMSPATAQNYVSAANRVMEIARKNKDVWVSPTKDGGIPERNGIATENKSVDQDKHQEAINTLPPRTVAILEMQRELGLRHKESMLINSKNAIKQIEKTGKIKIENGTKGGRAREIPILRESQIAALSRAADIQGRDRSLVPAGQSYITASREVYRQVGELGLRQHGERHAYAQARYQDLVGVPCPVVAGVAHGRAHIEHIAIALGIHPAQARHMDRQARMTIAEELGHGRMEVTHAYLG